MISLALTRITYKNSCTMPGTQNATMIWQLTLGFTSEMNLQLWLVNVTFLNTVQWPEKWNMKSQN